MSEKKKPTEAQGWCAMVVAIAITALAWAVALNFDIIWEML